VSTGRCKTSKWGRRGRVSWSWCRRAMPPLPSSAIIISSGRPVVLLDAFNACFSSLSDRFIISYEYHVGTKRTGRIRGRIWPGSVDEFGRSGPWTAGSFGRAPAALRPRPARSATRSKVALLFSLQDESMYALHLHSWLCRLQEQRTRGCDGRKPKPKIKRSDCEGE
jgi:hypothetical protein